jgi:AbrB family looped-hinge helix DNA binding protein
MKNSQFNSEVCTMEMAKVTSKGQITIPISIRRRLSINEGDKLLFIDRPEGVMMVNPDMLGGSQEAEPSTSSDKAAMAEAKPKLEVAAAIADPPAASEKAAEKSQEPTQPIKDDAAILADTADTADAPPEAIRPAPSPVSKKNPATVGNLNLDSLLDEIRSIGQKI